MSNSLLHIRSEMKIDSVHCFFHFSSHEVNGDDGIDQNIRFA